MRLQSVHTREIDAEPQVLGRLLDSLGGADDRLWPSDRWPTMPMTLDRPLGVGATGGHGPVRYAVEQHQPGHSVVFRFSPGTGLVGVHRLDIERATDRRARLTVTLDAEVPTALLLISRVVRRYHDVMAEDLLDRAERETTGHQRAPSRRPLWLRAANALDIAIARRKGSLPTAGGGRGSADDGVAGGRWLRLVRVGVPTALAALAGLHAAWALGWRWPGGSDQVLARRVMDADMLPPSWAVWGVSALLAAAAVAVASTAVGSRRRFVRLVTCSVAAGLLARAVVFVPSDLWSGLQSPFAKLDLAVYSPLCLALGVGAVVLLQRSEDAAVQEVRTATVL